VAEQHTGLEASVRDISALRSAVGSLHARLPQVQSEVRARATLPAWRRSRLTWPCYLECIAPRAMYALVRLMPTFHGFMHG
jgi:hypothetical protein